MTVSIQLNGCTKWMLTKCIEGKSWWKLHMNSTSYLESSWKQHSTKQQLYSHLPSISYIYFFHHTTCGSTCDTLASSAANQGDNTVSVAQGGTATPGATEQLLPPDRVFKKKIYVYTRSTKSAHYIRRSFIFILVQFVI